MTNKIEISRELAESLTRSYPAEITDQATMQAIRIEAVASLDELRALLAEPAVERQSFVQSVPDHCDRITWRGSYYHLPMDAVERQEPVKWWNGCDREVPTALRFLANNERPYGGESRFNAAHLYQLAGEIERMAKQPLYTSPPAPVAVVAVVIDERAEFEKSVIGKAERFHPDLSKYGIDGEYKHAQFQYAWDLWQARACLDKVKEMNK